MQQVPINEEILEELLYFTDLPLEEVLHEELLKKPSLALLLKRSSENLPNNIDDVVCQMVYGNLRKPPGESNCPYQKVIIKKEEEEDLIGIWAPPNSLSKAMALKWLFPNISGPYKFPDTKPVPPHIAIGFDAFKYKDVMELGVKYPGQVMKYGFFTSDIPGCGQLIAKTVEKFENRTDITTFEEKIVVQLSKTNTECFSEFSELGPSYVSASAVEGEEECKLFFSEGYDVPEEIVSETKKKSKKKLKSRAVALADPDAKDKDASSLNVAAETEDQEEHLEEDNKENEGDENEEEEEDDALDEADKATSPMDSTRIQTEPASHE